MKAQNVNNIPSEYKPIGMWGYFGYNILFMLPVIGWIMLVSFAVGGTSNKNLKNYARSYFCTAIIVIILAVIVIGGAGGMLLFQGR